MRGSALATGCALLAAVLALTACGDGTSSAGENVAQAQSAVSGSTKRPWVVPDSPWGGVGAVTFDAQYCTNQCTNGQLPVRGGCADSKPTISVCEPSG